MKRPVHHNIQSNVVSLNNARAERTAKLDVSISRNVEIRQHALINATLRKLDPPERAPVAAAQVFVHQDGSIETTITNVEPEHVGPVISALRRAQDLLSGAPGRMTAQYRPRERGVADAFFLLTAIQLLGFATAAYINTNPWLDVALTVGGEAIAAAACRMMLPK